MLSRTITARICENILIPVNAQIPAFVRFYYPVQFATGFVICPPGSQYYFLKYVMRTQQVSPFGSKFDVPPKLSPAKKLPWLIGCHCSTEISYICLWNLSANQAHFRKKGLCWPGARSPSRIKTQRTTQLDCPRSQITFL